MMTLGITGRSGCGKSSVTAYFAAQGICCADGDQIARQILQPGSPCLEALAAAFGGDIIRQNVLDRRLLADRAFATPEGTARLSAITHPEIIRRLHCARDAAAREGRQLFFVDAAAIVGTPFAPECDRLLVVTAPYDRSVERICARDGISAEMAARRLHAQPAESILLEKADYVIQNDAGLDSMLQKAAAVLEQIRKEFHAQN